MRRGDLDTVKHCLDRDVTWRRAFAEIGGVDLRGQINNVFRVGCGRIVAVEDYARRDEALVAAGAAAPRWECVT